MQLAACCEYLIYMNPTVDITKLSKLGDQHRLWRYVACLMHIIHQKCTNDDEYHKLVDLLWGRTIIWPFFDEHQYRIAKVDSEYAKNGIDNSFELYEPTLLGLGFEILESRCEEYLTDISQITPSS